MNQPRILHSEVVRLFAARIDKVPQLENAWPKDFYDALEDRYKFLQGPRVLDDYDLNKGVTLLRGRFSEHVVERAMIYPSGVLCSGIAPTEVYDSFCEDVLGWTNEFLGSALSFQGVYAYQSRLEFTSSTDISRHFPQMNAIGRLITGKLQEYGHPVGTSQLTQIGFHSDTTSPDILLKPPAFVFDRRADQPFESSLFYSSAPLRTADHVAVLTELERLFS